MGILERIWRWLTSSSSGVSKKGHPDLYPIDVEKLATELELRQEARRLGEAGVPAASASSLSGPEALIVQKVEKARQDYVDWAVLRLTVLNQDLARQSIRDIVDHARQADKEFERKASALLTEQESLLGRLGNSARNRRAELSAFCLKHRLQRDADYPDASGRYLRWGLLFAMIVVEGVINSGFFAKGVDTGLLGGFVYAASLAALNVLSAFMLGRVVVRYIYHSNLVVKVIGSFGLVASIGLMFSVGLVIGHMRDSLATQIEEPARAALQAMLSNPFHLSDVLSWTLLGITVFFGVIALVDGISMDDKYPGYGDVARKAIDAADEYEEELASVREDLEILKEETLKTVQSAVEKSQVIVTTFESLIRDKESAGSRLQTAIRDADNSLDALLRVFRTENQLARQGAAAPGYFDSSPELRPIRLPDFSLRQDKVALEEQKALLDSLQSEVQAIRARIQEAFNQRFDQLKPLDTHFAQGAD